MSTDCLPLFLTDDGYDMAAYFPKGHGLKHNVRIVFRPPMFEDKDALVMTIGNAVADVEDAKERAKLTAVENCKAILEHLKSWEFVGIPNDKLPAPSVDILRRVPPILFRRLMDCCVYGIDSGDRDPDADTDGTLKSPSQKLDENQGN